MEVESWGRRLLSSRKQAVFHFHDSESECIRSTTQTFQTAAWYGSELPGACGGWTVKVESNAQTVRPWVFGVHKRAMMY